MKPYNIIMIGWRSEQEQKYAELVNANVRLTYRTAIDYSANSAAIQRWTAAERSYFFTVAASDRVGIMLPLYDETGDTADVIKEQRCAGFYMHEVVTYGASTNGWDWPKAAAALDWNLIAGWVAQAKARGKKVVWSEPAYGWQVILGDPTAKSMFASWVGTVIPMYATNFHTATSNLVPTALTSASQASVVLSSPLGESVQSWYFRDDNETPTTAATVSLCNQGWIQKAKYFQIEGTYSDMAWGTPYMQGISEFCQKLSRAS